MRASLRGGESRGEDVREGEVRGGELRGGEALDGRWGEVIEDHQGQTTCDSTGGSDDVCGEVIGVMVCL